MKKYDKEILANLANLMIVAAYAITSFAMLIGIPPDSHQPRGQPDPSITSTITITITITSIFDAQTYY
jgi:hypothetical protein